MDTLCGIGLPELIILALLGFVVIGPERSRDVALKAGRLLRQVMTSAWWREASQVATAIRNLPTTLVRMAELEETQAILQRTLHEIEGDLGQIPQPGTAPESTEISADPWGIRHAAAGTRLTPRTPSPSGEASPPGLDSAHE